ncbi:MAG: hypothetical protein KDE50_37575 [Caldilineaceae bacterium]|nr:hypothetical protein [Caldilineaceae bacterium]
MPKAKPKVQDRPNYAVFDHPDQILDKFLNAAMRAGAETDEEVIAKLLNALGGEADESVLRKVIEGWQHAKTGYVTYLLAMANIVAIRIDDDGEIVFGLKDSPEARAAQALTPIGRKKPFRFEPYVNG